MNHWDGQCQRCNKRTKSHTMSKFNTDLICLGCSNDEKQHPDYDKAVNTETHAIMGGNYNFPGIGWTELPKSVAPADLFGE